VLVVVVVSIIAAAAFALSAVWTSPKTTVTYTELGFEWDTPPSAFCNNSGINTPGVPFTVNSSQTFNVSWYLICTTGGPSTITSVSMVDESIVSGSSSGTLVSSNLPVTIYPDHYTYFNVTCIAPTSGYTGPLMFLIQAQSP
jgi:hypothetical protein